MELSGYKRLFGGLLFVACCKLTLSDGGKNLEFIISTENNPTEKSDRILCSIWSK